jgi:hypothetical protein
MRRAEMRTARTAITAVLGAGVVSVSLGTVGCGSGDDSTTTPTAAATSTTTTSSTPAASLPEGNEHVSLDPAEFTTNIDNPYLPLAPGNHWVYREVENGETNRVDVTVTPKIKTVAAGIKARVIHDVVSHGGQPVEATYDWYAQDSSGNVWYMGEDTKEYKNGKVASTAGSWEAGVKGAEAGVVMPAQPEAGMSYREELYHGEAEDVAKITGTDAKVTVPFGSYDQVVTTTNTTPLEPKVLEHKWYAQGIGPVREALLSGGHGDTVLVQFTQG